MNIGGWGRNPNKYLWRNGTTWWMRVQPYDPVKTERLAFNLKTRDLEEARKRRDEMVAVNEWRFSR
jgi:hypothetical protein